jgi:transposase
MANHQRDPDKERFWREAVARWRRSGEAIRDYCRKQQLSEPSFYAWRRTLAGRRGSAPPRRRRSAAKVSFLPVQVVSDGAPIELLCGGHVIRLRPGFDPATLAQLLAVLRERPC